MVEIHKQGLYNKYFVLKPKGNDEYAHASRMAMKEYAKCIEKTDEQLANSIREWITKEMVDAYEYTVFGNRYKEQEEQP